jgi:hypothetical protein
MIEELEKKGRGEEEKSTNRQTAAVGREGRRPEVGAIRGSVDDIERLTDSHSLTREYVLKPDPVNERRRRWHWM